MGYRQVRALRTGFNGTVVKALREEERGGFQSTKEYNTTLTYSNRVRSHLEPQEGNLQACAG